MASAIFRPTLNTVTFAPSCSHFFTTADVFRITAALNPPHNDEFELQATTATLSVRSVCSLFFAGNLGICCTAPAGCSETASKAARIRERRCS